MDQTATLISDFGALIFILFFGLEPPMGALILFILFWGLTPPRGALIFYSFFVLGPPARGVQIISRILLIAPGGNKKEAQRGAILYSEWVTIPNPWNAFPSV